MGRGKSAKCVDVISVPFGFRIVMGLGLIRLLTTGKSQVPNVSVVPVSNTKGVFDVVGGPLLVWRQWLGCST